jgi:hypothetical protein
MDSTKTIDVNIPASTFEALAEAVVNHLDLDTVICDSELAGTVSELERKVDRMESDDFASSDDLRDLEYRVEELENESADKGLESLKGRVEELEATHVHPDQLQALSNRVEYLITALREMSQAIQLNLIQKI